MKPRSQPRRRETAALIERAQGVLLESKKLLEQREAQLKQLEQVLEQNPEIAHGAKVRCLQPQIGALLQNNIHEL
jgi:16S rRNA G1207 methylase RsmC